MPAILSLVACGGSAPTEVAHETGSELPPIGNVLVVLMDEIGIDKVAAYGVGGQVPPTPVLDGLIAEGVLFENAWATPSCSPTRAALLTGRHPRRTGIGRWIDTERDTWELADEEVTIPEMLSLAPRSWTTSLTGKWHLSVYADPQFADHPLRQGFDWAAGSVANLTSSSTLPSEELGYYRWEKATNGELSIVTTYATTDTVDDAVERVAAMPEPWFLYVPFNAAHVPSEVPPEELTGDVPSSSAREIFDAAEIAMDTELGRLLASMPEDLRQRTTVIVLGDNGTPNEAIAKKRDRRHGKRTVYELGVRVPLVVTGPFVRSPGSRSEALVHVVDLFATVAEIAGVDLTTVLGSDGRPVTLDAVSLMPYLRDPTTPSARSILYSEEFFPNGPGPTTHQIAAVRDLSYKLLQDEDGSRHLFALGSDGLEEGPDLLAEGAIPSGEAATAYGALTTELDARLAMVQGP
ncbi:MAG: sulfatase-like hydrolase/transferase [Alphaproteobacteria bacterium]|nr:sulfatase-like hydrolase/transferase [Alphaproteobacteria bacterium]MCB9698576.1 sulfatase-like hydrolase/transferase [Alphaproteobacteria bacterium]